MLDCTQRYTNSGTAWCKLIKSVSGKRMCVNRLPSDTDQTNSTYEYWCQNGSSCMVETVRLIIYAVSDHSYYNGVIMHMILTAYIFQT